MIKAMLSWALLMIFALTSAQAELTASASSLSPLTQTQTEAAGTGEKLADVTLAERDLRTLKILSGEHVNLVRVAGELITDVIYDTQALEVEPDRERGIVFIRVRPAWKAQAIAESHNETAAFFNTKESSYGITFQVLPVASQTIEIKPQNFEVKRKPKTDDTTLHLTDSGAVLANSTYIETLKTLTKRALKDERSVSADIGAVSSVTNNDFEFVNFAERVTTLEGIRYRERRAYHAPGFFVEVIEAMNFKAVAVPVAIEALARAAHGVLAIGTFRRELKPGAETTLVLLRRIDETEGVALALDSLGANR